MQADAGSLLTRIGLAEGLWRRKAAELSVGQQQRVAAARALIGAPEVVIADEPTSALDAPLRDDFMQVQYLRAVHRHFADPAANPQAGPTAP